MQLFPAFLSFFSSGLVGVAVVLAKKKKSGKAKQPAANDAAGAGDQDDLQGLSPDEMQATIIRLREEVNKEREERNYFQLERDKINTFWEITKKQLAEARAEMRNKDRELEEAEEKHAVEIKVYKQKVKHLLYEHQNQIAELRTEAALAKKLVQDELREEAAGLRNEKRSLRVELKELQINQHRSSQHQRLDHDRDKTQLYDQMRQQAQDIRRKYEQQLDHLRRDLDLQRRVEVHEIEERKNLQITALMRQHEQAFGDIKNYYNDITLNNLALINSLKEQVEGMRTKEQRTEKLMAELVSENRRLIEPLKAAEARVVELTKSLEKLEHDREALRSAKVQLKLKEDELKQLSWENEVLRQRFQTVETERDDLYDRFVRSIYEVQQKTGFKNLLLEKKLETLHAELETKEAQLNEVLASSSLDPTAVAVVTQRLEDIMESKNAMIKSLQFELARVAKMHNETVSAVKVKLNEAGLPIEELGFDLKDLSLKQDLGRAPGGLSTSA
ncbi:uncharacterized protein MONBRDRAFT_33818 [Monosiga brevicollis MX1]|uniref:Growth arrest-specific protein 8 domain-containing protein n=1 Tax=Monosiga brevicollis TaxID=81824 RepID=A9V7Q8_MONBE|nr:uncharacterized protein MONBRDRAFT_33818 [Monosiga brevicollis MX1]EDQ86417.1 predicted protein [Monosiga brevicollis MX1]|eukprot:XP_001748807.1 hypothetical protein [Monosiga brevicollis MX1]